MAQYEFEAFIPYSVEYTLEVKKDGEVEDGIVGGEYVTRAGMMGT